MGKSFPGKGNSKYNGFKTSVRKIKEARMAAAQWVERKVGKRGKQVPRGPGHLVGTLAFTRCQVAAAGLEQSLRCLMGSHWLV